MTELAMPAAADLLSVALDPGAITASYDLQVKRLSGTLLIVTYSGIEGRDPKASGDYMAIWPQPSSVPWGTAPMKSEAITSDDPVADQPFNNLNLAAKPYVVAYSVGSDTTGKNIAAVVPLGAGGTPGPLQAITVTTAYVGTDTLAINYTAPVGATPNAFGHQLVLVQGQQFLSTTPILATTNPSNSSVDIAAFSNVTMTVGQWFTVAYLAGSAAANVAATVSFLVSG